MNLSKQIIPSDPRDVCIRGNLTTLVKPTGTNESVFLLKLATDCSFRDCIQKDISGAHLIDFDHIGERSILRTPSNRAFAGNLAYFISKALEIRVDLSGIVYLGSSRNLQELYVESGRVTLTNYHDGKISMSERDILIEPSLRRVVSKAGKLILEPTLAQS